jgi:hypothetical protein
MRLSLYTKVLRSIFSISAFLSSRIGTNAAIAERRVSWKGCHKRMNDALLRLMDGMAVSANLDIVSMIWMDWMNWSSLHRGSGPEELRAELCGFRVNHFGDDFLRSATYQISGLSKTMNQFPADSRAYLCSFKSILNQPPNGVHII